MKVEIDILYYLRYKCKIYQQLINSAERYGQKVKDFFNKQFV